MDSLNDTLSLEQFMAGCEGVGTHPGLGGLGVGMGGAHLGMSVPLRTLELTPVKDIPSPPSSMPNNNTTMSVLTPVKAERLQPTSASGQDHHSHTQHHQQQPQQQPQQQQQQQQQQSSSQHQTSHQSNHHGSNNHQSSQHHNHSSNQHTRISADSKSVKSEGKSCSLLLCFCPETWGRKKQRTCFDILSFFTKNIFLQG